MIQSLINSKSNSPIHQRPFTPQANWHSFLWLCHYAGRAFDHLKCWVQPGHRLVVRYPLEVHYSRVGWFGRHALVSYMSHWHRPNIAATYCVFEIARLLDETENRELSGIADFVLTALESRYNRKLGKFTDTVREDTWDADFVNFEATYYAIKVMTALASTRTNNTNWSNVVKRIKFDKQTTGKYLIDFALSVATEPSGQLGRESDMQNFANLNLVEKAISASHAIGYKLERDEIKMMTSILEKFEIVEHNEIVGFRLFFYETQSSITANKSGLSIPRDMLLRRKIDYRFIAEKIVGRVLQKRGRALYGSNLLNVYNSLFIFRKLQEICPDDAQINALRQRLSDYVEGDLDRMQSDLFHEGGFMFKRDFRFVPNLYATRLMIDVLARHNRRSEIDVADLQRFIWDCWDTKSGLFRMYPLLSKYYRRNFDRRLRQRSREEDIVFEDRSEPLDDDVVMQ